MNLPNPFIASSGEAPVFFLSVLVSDGRLQSSLGKVLGGEVSLVDQSDVHEFTGDDDCLIKADESLQNLGSESEGVNEVVFGFEESWVKKDGVVASRKPLLKKLTEKLGLEPVGFVPIAEALTQYLITNDPMLSAVCLYSQADFIYVYLIKQGKIVNAEKVGRSGDIVVDFTEGLGRLSQVAQDKNNYFPAKILLVSSALASSEIEEKQQDLLQHPWQEKHPFLQVPTVEVLPVNTLITAVTQQGGRAFAKVKNIPLKPQSTDQNTAVASSFGVPISGDTLSESVSLGNNSNDDGMMVDGKWEDNSNSSLAGVKVKKSGFIASHKKYMIGGFVIGLFSLVILAFGFMMFASKADVVLTLATVTVSKDVKITLDPTAEESDPEKLILSASLVTKEIDGSDEIETTGVKLVGEKATGKVTIYNKTTSQKRFGSGTKFKNDKYTFTLDGDVEVASASVEEKHSGETKQYGKVEASVTATEIGAESNLATNVNMSIDSFSDDTYYASVIEDFKGGSSREIQVVSDADVKELTKSVTDTLKEEALEAFKADSGNGKYLEPIGDPEQIDKTLSDNVGKEVDSVTLDLTMKFSAIEYATDDLKPLTLAALGDEVPENYVLVDEDPEILSSPSQEATEDATAEGVIVLEANISAKATPIVDLEALKQSILGKKIAEAQHVLDDKKEIKSSVITLWPKIAAQIIGKLPNKPEYIMMSVEE